MPGSLAQYYDPFAPPPPLPSPTTRDAQRNAVSAVRNQANWVLNSTRTASNYGPGGSGVIGQQFQGLRTAFSAFTATLNQRQQAQGANEMAELAAGLDIIQEAFANYNDDIASGRPVSVALGDLSQVIYKATNVWLQEFNKDCARLRVGS